MSKIVGIDLGTTNSVIAVYEAGQATVIPTAEGGRTAPSIVAFTKSGERLVGQTAKRQATINPENTIFSVKRFIGRHSEDAATQNEISACPIPACAGRMTTCESKCRRPGANMRRRRSRPWCSPN